MNSLMFFAVNNPRSITKRSGESEHVVDILDKSGKISRLHIPTRSAIDATIISKDHYYLISHPELKENYVTVHPKNSKIYGNVTPFKVNKQILDQYRQADMTGVLDALNSPRNRRVSLKGEVKSLSDVILKDHSKRREFNLYDSNVNRSIKVKVWESELSILNDIKDGDSVTVTNLRVDHWNPKDSSEIRVSCSATPESAMIMGEEVVEKKRKRTTRLTVLAISEDGIFTEEEGDIIVPENLMPVIKTKSCPVTLQCEIENNTLVAIELDGSKSKKEKR